MRPEDLGRYYESILDKEVRKEGGIYYTPPFIVDYMIENSLGELLKNKTPDEAAMVKIVDPACGGGVFLLGAYQYLLNWHEKHVGKLTLEKRCKILIDAIFGVDIDPLAVEITKYCLSILCLSNRDSEVKDFSLDLDTNIRCGNSLVDMELYRQKEFSRVFKQGGFDIVIGNPPYLKEGRISKTVFGLYNNSPYYQGKMDLWYMFACYGIDLLNKGGHLCFIATSNWVTSSGASKLRNKVVSDTQIKQLIDFGNFMIFESASVQTMIMLFSKDDRTDHYKFDYRKISGDAVLVDVLDLLNKRANNKAAYLFPKIVRHEFKDGFLTFSSNDVILDKIAEKGVYLMDDEIAQGIVPNPDVVTSRNIRKIPQYKIEAFNIKVGDGVFVLSKNRADGFPPDEQKHIKQLYEPTGVEKYCLSNSNARILYMTKQNDNDDAPQIIEHLEKYKEIMEDRRENLNGKLNFFNLHWPRNSAFFEMGEKILSVRKCNKPTFAYTEKEAYVMMSVNVIKTNRFNLKYLVGVLNSRLTAFWLQNKGKMQGGNYQVDKEPLLQIPIIDATKEQAGPVIARVDQILDAKASDSRSDTSFLEHEIDVLVYALYGLTAEEIAVVEGGEMIKKEKHDG